MSYLEFVVWLLVVFGKWEQNVIKITVSHMAKYIEYSYVLNILPCIESEINWCLKQ